MRLLGENVKYSNTKMLLKNQNSDAFNENKRNWVFSFEIQTNGVPDFTF